MQIEECRIWNDFRWYYLFTVPLWMFLYGLQICFWPFYNMIKTFFIKCQYETATGTEKNKLHKELEANVMKTIRAKLFEGCLEATFQVHYHFIYTHQIWYICHSAATSGGAGWALAHLEFGISVNPITTRGQIMPTILLLAHPDLKTRRHLW